MYRVIWLQAALDELTDIWLQADSASRQAIREASNHIDHVLVSAPGQTGESRTEGERIHFEPPLGITFDINTAEHRVRILHVWDTRRRRR